MRTRLALALDEQKRCESVLKKMEAQETKAIARARPARLVYPFFSVQTRALHDFSLRGGGVAVR